MADINTYAVTTGTSPSLTTDYLFTSIGSALRRMSLALVGQVIGFLQGGTGATTTYRMQDKLRDMQVSVLDYGAVRTTTAPSATATASDTAFTNAMNWAINSSSLTNVVHVPAGYYRLANPLEIPANGDNSVNFVGEGMSDTHLYFNTTSTTALACITIATGVNDRSIVVGMQDIHCKYYGTQTRTDLHGILVTHKINTLRVRFDGFPGDGAKFETSLAGNNTWCVFFAKFADTIFENCGGHGMNVRYGANANLFIKCTFKNNASDGLVHQVDGGGATYGNVFWGCDADNNGGYGWNLINGTNVHMYFCGSENNSGTSDVFVGDNVLRSWLSMSRLTSTSRIRVGTFNSNVKQVWYAGQLVFGDS